MEQLSKSAEILKTYGQAAFGLVSLLILWVAIIAPELERSRRMMESFNESVAACKEIVREARAAAADAKSSAASSADLFARIERTHR